MTIVRHWAGGFSLFLHYTIWKNQAKMLGQKWKKFVSGSSEIVKNKENAFMHLGWRVQLIDY